MKYRFRERRHSQPSTYLFHTLDVHVKLYGVNFFFIRWNWEFQPWILLLLSQQQWLWSAFFLFMFFPDRIPCKVPSIIALIDIWQRDKDWTEIKPLDDCISRLKSNLQMDEELDWNQNGKWTEMKMENGHVIGFKSSVHVLKVESLIRSVLRYTVIGREGALLNAIIVSSYKPILEIIWNENFWRVPNRASSIRFHENCQPYRQDFVSIFAIYWQDFIFQMKYASKPTLMKTFSISFKHHDHQKLRRQTDPIIIKKDSLYEYRVS